MHIPGNAYKMASCSRSLVDSLANQWNKVLKFPIHFNIKYEVVASMSSCRYKLLCFSICPQLSLFRIKMSLGMNKRMKEG